MVSWQDRVEQAGGDNAGGEGSGRKGGRGMGAAGREGGAEWKRGWKAGQHGDVGSGWSEGEISCKGISVGRGKSK